MCLCAWPHTGMAEPRQGRALGWRMRVPRLGTGLWAASSARWIVTPLGSWSDFSDEDRQALGGATWLTQGYTTRSRVQSPCVLPLSFSIPDSGFMAVPLGDRRRTKECPRAFSLGIAISKRKVSGSPFPLAWAQVQPGGPGRLPTVRPKALGLGSLDLRGSWAFLKGRTPSFYEARSPPPCPAFSFLPLLLPPPHGPPGSRPLEPTAPPHPATPEPPPFPPSKEKNELQSSLIPSPTFPASTSSNIAPPESWTRGERGEGALPGQGARLRAAAQAPGGLWDGVLGTVPSLGPASGQSSWKAAPRPPELEQSHSWNTASPALVSATPSPARELPPPPNGGRWAP